LEGHGIVEKQFQRQGTEKHFPQHLHKIHSREIGKMGFFKALLNSVPFKIVPADSESYRGDCGDFQQTSSKMLGNLKQHPLSDSAAPRPYNFYTDQKWLQSPFDIISLLQFSVNFSFSVQRRRAALALPHPDKNDGGRQARTLQVVPGVILSTKFA
jgi:hypothetical protein